ncbi:MAG TPA: mechanosensitive ion channel domain-containing protein [Verrucomicrobiae bacterium]|nr:mechanosensitive ion channel domain-containing protein [Verrucomicrobiae bacterium]
MEKAITTLQEMAVRYGFQVLGAVLIVAAGYIVARKVGEMMQEWLGKRELEPPLRLLVVRFIRLLIMALTTMIAIQQLGVNLVPLIAGLSVLGVGVGLALQGVFGNLAAGIVIIFVKPFRVGEYIEILGVHGTVDMIDLLSTKLVHPDRSKVVIPNRKILGEILHNYGKIRQLDIKVGVAYDTDLKEALKVIREVLERNSRVLQDPVPFTGVTHLSDSSIEISVFPWVAVNDYGIARADLCQALVEGLRANRIAIPFPQREVRILNPGPALAA